MDEKGRTWQLMYFLTELVEVVRHLSEFGDYLEPERYWGFTRIGEERIDHISSDYGSVDRLIAEMLGREGDDLPPQLLTASDRNQKIAESSLEVDRIAHGDVDEKLIPDTEGRKRVASHVRYERSPRNRRRAIQMYGTVCKACGFDLRSMAPTTPGAI